jgi:hypothetical protein
VSPRLLAYDTVSHTFSLPSNQLGLKDRGIFFDDPSGPCLVLECVCGTSEIEFPEGKSLAVHSRVIPTIAEFVFPDEFGVFFLCKKSDRFLLGYVFLTETPILPPQILEFGQSSAVFVVPPVFRAQFVCSISLVLDSGQRTTLLLIMTRQVVQFAVRPLVPHSAFIEVDSGYCRSPSLFLCMPFRLVSSSQHWRWTPTSFFLNGDGRTEWLGRW